MTVNYDITFHHNLTGEYLTLPVLPTDGRINYEHGDTQAIQADVIALGSIEFPLGVDLDVFNIKSFFPGLYDPGYVRVRPTKLSKPISYQEKFLKWKEMRNSIQVIIPAAGINSRMYIASYKSSHGRGQNGDIEYTMELRQYREVKATKVPVEEGGTVTKKQTPAARPPVPQQPKPKTYTVQEGDTVTLIALRLDIRDWRETLYAPNRDIIGPNPNILKPGMVLVLP